MEIESGLSLEDLKKISELEFDSSEMRLSVTIKEWLKELLCNVWKEKDGFSGKRAFGSSDWEYDVYNALAENGYIDGVIDQYGDWNFSSEALDYADLIIKDIIIEVM